MSKDGKAKHLHVKHQPQVRLSKMTQYFWKAEKFMIEGLGQPYIMKLEMQAPKEYNIKNTNAKILLLTNY